MVTHDASTKSWCNLKPLHECSCVRNEIERGLKIFGVPMDFSLKIMDKGATTIVAIPHTFKNTEEAEP